MEELHAPAHSSPKTDLEFPVQVAIKSKNTVFTLTFRKTEIATSAKITRAPCRRRTGEALLRAEKFGDLIKADHKVLNEGCESRDHH